MKKLSDTYKELGIDFIFPIEINDTKGNRTYYEKSEGYWEKCEYDDNGNRIYFEDSDDYWYKRECDDNGKETYFEDSDGYWCRYEYDDNGKETYFEDSKGTKCGTPRSQSCDGKVIEVDGKKYKLTAL